MIKMDVYSTQAVIRSQKPLTVGLVGARLDLSFSEDWKSLVKTVVFRQGTVTRDVVGVSDTAVIPWEVLQQAGVPLEIGVYGTDSTGTVVIPTVWASTGPVLAGATPSGDPGTAPTPEVWEQLLARQGNLDALDTEARTDLVAAINGANRAVCLVTVTPVGEDGWEADRTPTELYDALVSGKYVGCCMPTKALYLPLDYGIANCFDFRTVRNHVEYTVRLKCLTDGSTGVAVSTITLATDQDKLPNPQKLTFTGAVEAEYDGSRALVVEIPKASSHTGGLSVTDDGDGNVVIASTGAVSITDDGEGNVIIG